MTNSRAEWYERNGCSHAHCPEDCENPQPILADDGELYCGRCWFVGGEVVTKMIPCRPETCTE